MEQEDINAAASMSGGATFNAMLGTGSGPALQAEVNQLRAENEMLQTRILSQTEMQLVV